MEASILDSNILMKVAKVYVVGLAIIIFMSKVLPRTTRLFIGLWFCLIGMVVYQELDTIFQLIVLFLIIFAIFGSYGFSSIASQAKKWDDSPTKKSILQNNFYFDILLFHIFVAYIAGIAFWNFIDDWISVTGGIVCCALLGNMLNRIEEPQKVIKQTKEMIGGLSKTKVMRVQDIADSIETKKMTSKEKAQIVYDVALALSNRYENISLISLGNSAFLFDNEALSDIFESIHNSIKATKRMSKKDALKKFSFFAFNEFELNDLIIYQDSISKYWFSSDEYFIHDIHLDNFVFCESCLKAEFANKVQNDSAVWFCSSLCQETEKECLELSADIRGIDKHKHTTQFMSDMTTIAINATKGVEAHIAQAKILNNPKGHGLQAEIMNHRADILSGKDAKIVGGDNAKDGADRIVDGQEIQTKIYKTARRTVNAAFDTKGNSKYGKGNYRYYDKNGKPMQLEVSKDQYEQAIKAMEKKIEEGKVPGATDPKEAKNIIRKGHYARPEIIAATKFDTIESLKFDAYDGAIVATHSAGISFVLTFAFCYYKEGDTQRALKEASLITLTTGSKTFAIYMVGAQAQKVEVIQAALKQLIGEKSALAKSYAKLMGLGTGKAAKTTAATALRSNLVAAAAAMAVTSSIEVVQLMRGHISGMQCVKNIAVNAAGVAGGVGGALAGAALGSIVPGVGTAIGGFVGGMVGGFGGGALVKKIMDNFIEDDISKKQRVFFGHMQTLTLLFKLSQEEMAAFSARVNEMIEGNEKDFFGKKFDVSRLLPYSNALLKPIIVEIVSNRPIVPLEALSDANINRAITELADEVA